MRLGAGIGGRQSSCRTSSNQLQSNVGTQPLSLTCSNASVEDVLDEDVLGVLRLDSSDLKRIVQTFGSAFCMGSAAFAYINVDTSLRRLTSTARHRNE